MGLTILRVALFAVFMLAWLGIDGISGRAANTYLDAQIVATN